MPAQLVPLVGGAAIDTVQKADAAGGKQSWLGKAISSVKNVVGGFFGSGGEMAVKGSGINFYIPKNVTDEVTRQSGPVNVEFEAAEIERAKARTTITALGIGLLVAVMFALFKK